ncbi:SSI family serine proteinase inhibitor [Nonomuraea lactucae]|uniref:SSI family serine proteinase inhibitor n=1 Tax=Nonomuraea lactucae TaxID=2249762 RepID=UPI0019646F7B|nr:SSI family serine proteinase inhibitor [Nonomuraea lactucae]
MRSITTTALCGAFLMLAAAPAVADWGNRSTTLKITVTAAGQAPRTYTLNCDPDGGDHPDPARACALLRSAGGKLGALRKPAGNCGWVFQPYKVGVTGTWQGRNVSYNGTYTNLCRAKAAGAGVFAF